MKLKASIVLPTLIGTALFAPVTVAEEPIQPIRPVQEINLAQVELGKKLIFDPVFPSRDSFPVIHATISAWRYR